MVLPVAASKGLIMSSTNLLYLFEARVAVHPDAPAVSDENQMLTYAELDAAASAFAARLAAEGVGAQDRVAFHLARGVHVFVVILGILRAGAAYVAVDPRYPQVRRSLMIRDSRSEVMVVEPGSPGGGPVEGVRTIEFDIDAPSAETPSPAPVVGPDSAACVLFTSGSTGRPKAVILEHRNLTSFATDPALPLLGPGDRVAHVSNVSFDAFHYETWCAWAGGAEIVVMETMPVLLGRDLHRELRQRRITAMLVPSMALNHIVREDREAFNGLRVLCTGGDVLLPDTCRDLAASGFKGELYNLYGPTEATTACTIYHVVGLPDDADKVPIGRPLASAEVLVLDLQGCPVPDGVSGELHVCGAGVARGYLDRPDLTNERFHPDPHRPGALMYATGDLAVRRADGLLEFLGRIDGQVKIRGFRVEPGEVERALERHPSVREAVVLPIGSGQDRHLVALVVTDDQIPMAPLREHLAATIPDYMVPAVMARIDSIPVSENGKRDLDCLRQTAEAHARRRDEHCAPDGDVERYLAALWEALLSVEEVGATEDFFALGGNSLQAFRVVKRVREELGVQIEARDVLQYSELGQLAALIAARQGEAA
jgi:amino acid adenylation domain-containing protein